MNDQKPVANLRFDGIYQGDPIIVAGKGAVHFIRFYQDGCVLSVSSQEVMADEITTLLSKETIALSPTAKKAVSRGRYTLKEARLRYWVKGQRGRHDLTGEFRGDKLMITNTDGLQNEHSFYPIADYAP
jgi:hypothetical protein